MLNTTQLQTLKAYIDADPVLSVIPLGSDGDFDIAAALNQTATPSVVVWKSKVSSDEIMRGGIDWTRVDNLSVGKARIWDWMTRLGSIDPSKASIRSGIDATWVGTAADLAVRATVYSFCKRNASIFENLFATGVGTTASPAIMAVEGPVDYQLISSVRNS